MKIKDLREGAYYTATYKKDRKTVKISGQVGLDCYPTSILLYNSDEVGYANDDTYHDDQNYPFYLSINRGGYSGDNLEEFLKAGGVTDFKVVRDRRLINVIKSRRNIQFGDHSVIYKNKKFIFGCGAIECTLEDIKAVLEISTMGDVEDYYSLLQDYNSDIIKSFVKLPSSIKTTAEINAFRSLLEEIDGENYLGLLTEDNVYELLKAVESKYNLK